MDLYTKFKKKRRYLKFKMINRSTNSKKVYLEKKFKRTFGIDLNLEGEPKTFNQKIQFRKFYDKNPLYTLCADKFKVRDYVKDKIGEEFLVPLHLATKKLSEKQWNELPDQFVAKPNNCSGVIVVKDKKEFNYKDTSEALHKRLKTDYGFETLEKFYDDIEPVLIVEKLLPNDPEDYKFHCFRQDDGEYKIVMQIDLDRFGDHNRQVYDEDFNPLGFRMYKQNKNINVDKPENFEKMKEIAKKLAEGFDYVRVDLYSIEEKIYFGELTFCHGNGFEIIHPAEWDEKLGEYWNQVITK